MYALPCGPVPEFRSPVFIDNDTHNQVNRLFPDNFSRGVIVRVVRELFRRLDFYAVGGFVSLPAMTFMPGLSTLLLVGLFAAVGDFFCGLASQRTG